MSMNKKSVIMDAGEIIAEIKRMGAEYYGVGYAPRSSDWKEHRDRSLWPSGNRIYQIIIGERAGTKNINLGDWKYLVDSLGLQYPIMKSGRAAVKARREGAPLLVIPEIERSTTMAAHGKPFSAKRNPDSINTFGWQRRSFWDWRRRCYVITNIARAW